MGEMIVKPDVPYTHAQMMHDIARMRARYPRLTGTYNAGFSVEGRPLPVLTAGRGNTKVLFCAAHHAREHITAQYLMYSAEVFLAHAQQGRRFGDYDMKALLAACTMHILPMVNPDGVTLAQGGLMAAADPDRVRDIMMVRPTYAEWKANINGVDLNRHYPAQWDKKHVVVDAPASELFNGTAAAIEPEVRAVMRICRLNVFKAALSFHTKGEVIFFADAVTDDKIPHAHAFAQRLADVSGYALMPVSHDPGVYAAGFENWFRQELLYPGLLVELTPSVGGTVPHDEARFDALVWQNAKFICAEALVMTLAQA